MADLLDGFVYVMGVLSICSIGATLLGMAVGVVQMKFWTEEGDRGTWEGRPKSQPVKSRAGKVHRLYEADGRRDEHDEHKGFLY